MVRSPGPQVPLSNQDSRGKHAFHPVYGCVQDCGGDDCNNEKWVCRQREGHQFPAPDRGAWACTGCNVHPVWEACRPPSPNPSLCCYALPPFSSMLALSRTLLCRFYDWDPRTKACVALGGTSGSCYYV